MTFARCDLNVQLFPSFVDAVNSALRARKAELVLLYATTVQEGLYVLHDYLRIRARELAAHPENRVLVLAGDASDAAYSEMLAKTQPGDIVFFSELDSRSQPGNWGHAVSAASQFVSKGATVLASLHGGTEDVAQARLQKLWAAATHEGLLPPGVALPAHQLIPFAGQVTAVPV